MKNKNENINRAFTPGEQVIIIHDLDPAYWEKHYKGYKDNDDCLKSRFDGKTGTFVGYNDGSHTEHYYVVRIFSSDKSYFDVNVYQIEHYKTVERNNKLNELFDE
jgi:ribosomal protein L21E